MASRALSSLEARLVDRAADLALAEADVAALKAKRDAIIRELRALPDPPSARAVAALAGISNVQVLRIAEAPQ